MSDFCPHCGTPPDGDMGRDDCCWFAERDALAARVKELEDRIARAAKALDMMSTQGKGERRWVHWEERAFKARRILRGEDDTTGDTDG